MTGKVRTSLTSLERLEAQIRALPDGTPQGAAWEEALVRWVNAGGHPDLVKGWGWKQWPGRAKAGLPRIERGVDLIAEDRAGRLVAIQAKFRNDPDSPVKTGEVQKFVGAYRKHFPRRMLISNASSRARGIKEAVGDGEAELVLRTDLSESLFDWIASKPLPRPKVTPLPFQKEAAAAIKKHLEDGGRAQIVMACGSGKTYTTLLAMEALGSKRVLVLAPTLLLVKQLRDEWMRERTNTWATLAVCSDIGTNEGDDSTHVSPGEIGSKPTTDPAEIAIFLKSKGPYVVFGTYASSARIATAQKKAGVPAFDLVVADEAHRIAGAVGKADKEERAQRVVLDETGIRAERRLFATATPRVYGGDKKKDGEEIVLESMDDPARFGEEVYKLTFQQAVDLKRLVPYKLLVTIVTNEEVQALIHDRVYLDIQGKKITIDDLATAIAVRRAYKELGISRVISYHGNIKRARAFAQLVQEVKAPGKAPEAECVTGAMAVEDRKEALARLANAEGPYLITNARCLTEGIDVPALDAVAFADPRRSQVDIVQAVGRAMRKPRGTSSKTTGYIILPVFLSKADLKDPETAVESSAFAPVLQVLRALKAHDPYRATFFAKILVEQGKRPHKKGEGIDEILQVSIGKKLDKALAKRLEQAVELRSLEVSADKFDYWLALLQQFVQREGHARVPARHLEGARPLGGWVHKIRTGHYKTTREQSALLASVGFVWDYHEVTFEQNMILLERFVVREGNARVPSNHLEEGVKLGVWVNGVRSRRDTLNSDQTERLEALDFIWNILDETFERHIALLQGFVAREGHARVPFSHVEEGVSLGKWISKQRSRRDTLAPERLARLEALGFVNRLESLGFVSGALDEKFERLFVLLERYKSIEGHTRVPRNFVIDGERLGAWVSNLRELRDSHSPERIARLEELGFVWDFRADDFERKLALLQRYIAREGNALVPRNFSVDGVNLGQWVSTMRVARTMRRPGKQALSVERIAKLDALGFVWHAKDDAFEQNCLLLERFGAREGHLQVPVDDVEDGVRLGLWAANLRSKSNRLTANKVQRLKQIGFDFTTRRPRRTGRQQKSSRA
jgi:superfamily II DNA or RNA helicase